MTPELPTGHLGMLILIWMGTDIEKPLAQLGVDGAGMKKLPLGSVQIGKKASQEQSLGKYQH